MEPLKWGAKGKGVYRYQGCLGNTGGVVAMQGWHLLHGILTNKKWWGGSQICHYPKVPPWEAYGAAIQKACSRLPTIEADELRPDTSHLLKNHCPHNESNISKEEFKATKELREDHTRVVLTADKGVAMVVMDKQDYMGKALTLLTDTSNYNTINKDPTTRFRNKLISTLGH